jgi:hypothetical protein
MGQIAAGASAPGQDRAPNGRPDIGREGDSAEDCAVICGFGRGAASKHIWFYMTGEDGRTSSADTATAIHAAAWRFLIGRVLARPHIHSRH